ncbi:MAG TPA: hypothetical protein PKI14_07235 [Fervidobacterium sp.]|nr:hypothetical protein [Fervidobacterium sp.]
MLCLFCKFCTVTRDQVSSWLPWYTREEVLLLFGSKAELTVAEVLTSNISADDKLWVLLREELLPVKLLHEFALWCAETALTRAKITDKVFWNALKVKRSWLDGKATDEELDIAWKAVLGAAWESAAEFAAEAAVWKSAAAARNTSANAIAAEVSGDEQLAKLKEMLLIQTT